MRLPPYFFVFDVESVGLHGDGFAVGWVVVDTATGTEIDNGILVSSFERAVACVTNAGRAPDSDVQWVTENVLPALAGVEVEQRRGSHIRRQFWDAWRGWEAKGAFIAADVPWPVEARFLMQCARYTYWAGGPVLQSGPYPLIDVASVRLAKGLDPLATVERLENELPKHNPLADARQSARLLLEALRV